MDLHQLSGFSIGNIFLSKQTVVVFNM